MWSNDMGKKPKALSENPERLLPLLPWPGYTYIEGDTPHPDKEPSFHWPHQMSFPDCKCHLEDHNWQECEAYLYGFDLYNFGYLFEAHEAWESVWMKQNKSKPSKEFVQMLIHLAIAAYKWRIGNLVGVKGQSLKAFKKLEKIKLQLPNKERLFGLSFDGLGDLIKICYSSLWTQTQTELVAKQEIVPPLYPHIIIPMINLS